MNDPRRLTNPHLQPMLVDAQATYYPDVVQIYIPHEPILRFPSGYDKKKKSSPLTLSSKAEKENDEERSLRRAAKKVGDYILCNSFDMFVTFTIKDDRQNSERSKKRLLGWLKNQRNRNGKFRYIVVPEFHKDGVSLHFHALLGDFSGKIERATNPRTNKPLRIKGRNIYQISGYTLGFTNVKLIGNKPKDRLKLGAYLKKYITKDMPVFNGSQRYWASKGLKLPLIEDNPEEWYKHTKPDWIKETQNGTIMRFDLNKNPLADLFRKDKE